MMTAGGFEEELGAGGGKSAEELGAGSSGACDTTTGGQAGGAGCKFPFTLSQGGRKLEFNACTHDKSTPKPWCYTTARRRRASGKWGYCTEACIAAKRPNPGTLLFSASDKEILPSQGV